MFVNLSLLKSFHSKKFYYKYYGSSRISHYKNFRETTISRVDIRKYSVGTQAKNYKYLQKLQKSKIENFRTFIRNFSTTSKLYKEIKRQPTNNDNDFKSYKTIFIDGLGYIIFIICVFLIIKDAEEGPKISWEEFKYEILAKGEVKNLIVNRFQERVIVQVHDGAIIKNRKTPSKFYIYTSPDIKQFEEKLKQAEDELGIPLQDRVPVSYDRMGDYNFQYWILLLSSMLALAFGGYRLTKRADRVVMRTKYTLIDPLMGDTKGVKFSDVAGLKEAKAEIMDFVDYLKRPEVYRSLGARVPKGALLLGPPGCGKTLLAKAVATEANVPFLSMNGSEFIEIIGGLGAARVRDLFRDAKKRIPCIIYIDEIDAIGKKREPSFEYGTGEAEQTLNQLLVEMDGVVSNEGVVLLASTNRADVLDKALLRPGRFDRHILIDLPTFQERQEIFEHHLKSIHLENPPEMYSKRLAHLTPGFSGADIANVCNEAALHAARVKRQVVKGEDLEYAVERVVGGTEKRSSARTPEERKMFAYYEAGRALVGWLSKYGEALLKITIVARTDSPAGWTHFTPNDKHLYSLDDLKGKMCMGLAGRAAITLLFNQVTTAGEKDLKKVTDVAYALVRRFGMNQNIGLMSFDISGSSNTFKKPYSKVLGNLFDHEARKLVSEAYKESEKILLENKDKLIKLAEELLVKETLNYEDVVQLIGPPAFEGKTLIDPIEFVESLDQAIGTEATAENNKSG